MAKNRDTHGPAKRAERQVQISGKLPFHRLPPKKQHQHYPQNETHSAGAIKPVDSALARGH